MQNDPKSPFEKLAEELVASRAGTAEFTAALFATTLARESGPGHYRRQWLSSIDGITETQRAAINAL